MSNLPVPTQPHRIRRYLPLVVFFLALAIRLIGIGWGVPNKERYFSYHPDEPVNLMYARQMDFAKGDFDPGFYNYGTLYLTLIRLVDYQVSAFGPRGEDIQSQVARDAAVHLGARTLSALAGAGTALMVFLMLRRRTRDFFAALGAGLVAFAPGFVVHSRFMTVDVLSTFFVAVSLYFALKLIPNDGEEVSNIPKTVIWGGVMAGLAAGTKYTGAVALIGLFAAVLLAHRDSWPKLFGFGILSCTGAFLASTPGVIIANGQFIKDLSYELAHSRSGHGLVFEGLPGGFILHLVNLLAGMGLLAVILGFFGLGWQLRQKQADGIVMASFFLALYLVLGRAEVAFLRYTFPLLIPLAYALGRMLDSIEGQGIWGRVAAASGMLAVGGIPLGGGLWATSIMTAYMASPDPREIAIRQLLEDSPDARPVVGVVADPWFYSPPYYPLATAPRFVPAEIRLDAMRQTDTAGPIRVVQYIPSDGSPKKDWDLRLLTEIKPQYVVYSGFEADDLIRISRLGGSLRPDLLARVEDFQAFQKELSSKYTSRIVFSAIPPIHDLAYIRPNIWIWKRKSD